jgi:hypothetical protein
MLNPLYSNNTITYYDSSFNEEIIIDMLNIGKYFKYVYILCPLSTINYDSIMDKTIDKDIFNSILNDMILYKANIAIVRNMVHYGNIAYCESSIVNTANKFKYYLEESILILPIYTISFLNLQKYIDNFNGVNTFNNFYDILIMNNYFGNKISDKVLSIIKNLDEATYWIQPYNCLMNMTQLFDKRRFNLNILKSTDTSLKTLFSNIEMSPLKGNYIEQIFSTKNYVDPSEILKKKGYKLYSKVWNCEYTNDNITKLFEYFDDNFKYYLFCNLLVSKQYCHLVINNYNVLAIMKPAIIKNIYLYQYLFGYAWTRLYFEETINKFRVKTSDMYIFDINTASLLPLFHFTHTIPHHNPYMPIIVSSNILYSRYNVGGIFMDISDKDVRICNLDEFKVRLNLFISGNDKINLLEYINMNELNIAITGSTMTACCQYMHPLMKLFNNITFNDRFISYINEYYYDSDIDVMVKTEDTFKFIDITREFHEKIMLALCHFKNSEPENVKYILMNTLYLFVTEDFIKNNICNEHLDYQFITNNLDKQEIKKFFIPYARKLFDDECKKKLLNRDNSDINKYPELFKFNEENLLIKIRNYITGETLITNNNESEFTNEELDVIITTANDIEEKLKSNINLSDGLYLSASYKVKITAPELSHDFELFAIAKDDFMTTVANFHMPCVRAYYNGENVFMTPSFITAHLTFMNIDYKYFAGSKDPINIINKYRMRGFGVWLNKNELETYIKYCYEVPFWNRLLCINPNKKKSYDSCLGFLNICHKFFKPQLFCKDLINSKNKSEHNYNEYSYKREILQTTTYTLWYPDSNIREKIYLYLDNQTGYIIPFDPSSIDKYNLNNV